MRITLLIAAAALALAACSTPADGGALPPDDGSAGGDQTCLAGDPNCADDPSNGEGQAPPLPAELGDVTIADLLDGAPGRVTAAGFIVATGDEIRLCENLLESFPPQCGGLSIPLEGYGEVELSGLPTEGDVTWSDFPVTLEGEVVDGVFVVG